MLQPGEAAVTGLTVVTWYWGDHFAPEYVPKLRSMVSRHLSVPHEFVCVTDRHDLGKDVYRVYPPPDFHDAPNCIRRMKMYDPTFLWRFFGKTVLMLDLDIVIVGNITQMIMSPIDDNAPLALWKVGYPNHNRIYAGGIVLQQSGVLNNMWNAFIGDPLSFGTRALKHTYNREPGQGWGAISDQAMLNYWLADHPVSGQWNWTREIQPYTERMTALPTGAKIITIGHENIEAFQQHAWAKEHWK